MKTAGIQCLRLSQFTQNRPFYAILLSVRHGVAVPHVHDFTEIMMVISGTGRHRVNGQELPMVPGEIILVRPDDCHCVETAGSEGLEVINVAFASRAWRQFLEALSLEDAARQWEQAPISPLVQLTEHRYTEGVAAFEEILASYAPSSTSAMDSLVLGAFWQAVLGFFLPPSPRPAPQPGEPHWLAELCRQMQKEENLRAGIGKLQELSCVHPSHLSRVFRFHFGVTPSQWVKEKRLHRAAEFLHSSSLPIDEIAARCGFSSLSDFYRGFTGHFGLPPRAYRTKAQQAVAPLRNSVS